MSRPTFQTRHLWCWMVVVIGPTGGLGAPRALAQAPANWEAHPAPADSFFGVDVYTAGDVNGDSWADVIIGASGWSTNEGRAYVYYGSDTGLPPPDAPSWTADPTNVASTRFGFAVATAGDVNADGYADIIVSAYYWSGGEGRVYAYYGGPDGLGSTPDWTADPSNDGSYFGASVAGAGDVNGDGYDDIIVGADLWNGQASGEGRAYVYHGSETGLSAGTAPDWVADPTNGYLARFGFAVASAGDVNGDGFDDVVIGAAQWDSSFSDEGRAYVYFGSPSGLSSASTPDWMADPVDADGANFGSTVASAGDVNGDGFADLIVGAPGWDGDSFSEGRVFLYFGGSAGLSPAETPDWVADPANQPGSYCGSAVAGVGDLNGDGYDDIALAAPSWSEGGTTEGRVFVYWGGASGPTAPDAPDWVIEPSDGFSSHFGQAIGPAGDVNNDGHNDLIIGAFSWDSTPSNDNEGGAYVVWGHSECGNNRREHGEACDDGDTDDCTETCRHDCTGPYTDCDGNCPGLCDVVFSAGPHPPPPTRAHWGDNSVPALQFVHWPTRVPSTLHTLAFAVSEVQRIRGGRLYLDQDSDGQIGSTDVLVGETTVLGNELVITDLAHPLTDPVTFLLVVDIAFPTWTTAAAPGPLAPHGPTELLFLVVLLLGVGGSNRLRPRRHRPPRLAFAVLALALAGGLGLTGCPRDTSGPRAGGVTIDLSAAAVEPGLATGLPVPGTLIELR